MVPAPIGRGSVQICTLIEGFGEFPFVALARIRCHALPLFGHHPASGKRLGESEEPTPYETISISYGQGSLQLGFLSRGIVITGWIRPRIANLTILCSVGALYKRTR
jgi:hypothetical protein